MSHKFASISVFSLALVAASISPASAHGRYWRHGCCYGPFDLVGAVVVGAVTVATLPIVALADAVSGPPPRRRPRYAEPPPDGYGPVPYGYRDEGGYGPPPRPYGRGYAERDDGYAERDPRGYDGPPPGYGRQYDARPDDRYGPPDAYEGGPQGYDQGPPPDYYGPPPRY